VTDIRIYFEGDDTLREGFRGLLDSIFRAAHGKARIRLIAGRAKAVGDFVSALRSHPTTFNILLVDAEGPDDGRLHDRLKVRRDWSPPDGASVDPRQIHFMIQVMEAWFLADRAALASYYGSEFRPGCLPKTAEVEKIAKADVLDALKRATEQALKGRYHKTRHAPALLALVDASVVRKAAPACERLFRTLLDELSESDCAA